MPAAPRVANVAAARSVLGLTDSSTDLRYRNLVAPTDTPERQAQIAKESDCGLAVAGILRISCALPVPAPYKEQTAFKLLYALAEGDPWHEAGAFRQATLEAPPGNGDAVLYGDAPGKPPPASAHFETVTEATLVGKVLTLKCIAGGEKKDGLETIKEMDRVLTWNGTHFIDNANHRPLIGLIDIELFAATYPVQIEVDDDGNISPAALVED